MDERQELILKTITNEHIETGHPVGSGILVEKYKLDISPATVRNEMAELERNGFIMQPHTSAGRIPTEKAYQYLLDSLDITDVDQGEFLDIEKTLGKKDEQALKEVAKQISHMSGNAVFWAFHKHSLFYTGISNLFQQPEFSRINVIHDISEVIDRLDEIISGFVDKTEDGVHTFIGQKNPFGSIFGTTLAKYRLHGNVGMFGILGPMRMDYKKTISIVEFVNKKLK